MSEELENTPEEEKPDPLAEEAKQKKADAEHEKSAEKIERDRRRLGLVTKHFFKNLWTFTYDVLDLKPGLDYESTIKGIQSDVEFQGHSAWILVFSTLIASIGLNINNIPIIVGAMLISPLMGPILGIGLAVGINDFELLKKSVRSFGVAILISVFISAIYFFISPIKEPSFELVDRTSATVLSLFVAFFGGAAGIIAGSRSYKSNVVPGVAIATALMPPLCTAGYGLATFQMDFLLGALYLFFINSVFIAVPTYFYIRYMRFPVKEFVDPVREKKIRRSILIFLFVVIIPSGVIFWNVVQQSLFERDAELFINYIKDSLEDTETTVITETYDYHQGLPKIKIALMGAVIPKEVEAVWKNSLSEYDLEKCQLDVVQNRDYMGAIQEMEKKSTEQGSKMVEGIITQKEQEINALKTQIAGMQKEEFDFSSIRTEAGALFNNIEKFMYTDGLETNFNRVDTLSTIFIQFKPNVSQDVKLEESGKFLRWMKVKLGRENVVVREY